MGSDKRRSVRRWVRLEAEIVGADDFSRLGGRVIDLSEHGARLEVDERVKVGERLFLSFELPGFGHLDAECVAAHIGFDKRTNIRTVGVELTLVDDDAREALGGRLSKLPPTLPSRPGQSGDTYPAVTAAAESA